MRTRSALLAPFFFLVVACGGAAAQEPKTSADANTSEGSGDGQPRPPECEAIGKHLVALEDRPKGKGPADEMRSLTGAFLRLSDALKKEPIETPDFKKAVAELAAQAESFGNQLKSMGPIVDEMEQIQGQLSAWEKKVTSTANAFDTTCNNGPKAECDALGVELQKVPRIEGEKFAEHAAAIEKFIAAMEKLQVKDAKVKSSLTTMLGALKEGIPPMRRFATLLNESKKVDPAGEEFKAQVNRVAAMCGVKPEE
ncbi:hypothetical protein [Polyangium fumosum]|uniref:Uncharacterized protein n=1 Tax=Polyangium fumosum TaxID=889272 RepID=A0A4U1JAU1_9BACT|nr:hypothetical protein [Polyangium fumosum]TKD06436.1 hypothetical protein E8A74_19660 [Polyangium fumosum]